MNKILLLAGLTLFAGSNMAVASTDGLVFICHKGLNYTQKDVYMTFRGQLDEPHPVDNAALKSKLLTFLNLDAEHYRKTWNRSFFRRALNQPQSKKTDAEVIDYVSSHPEGVGYVASAPSGHQDVEVCGTK